MRVLDEVTSSFLSGWSTQDLCSLISFVSILTSTWCIGKMRSREVNRQASGRLETHCSPRTRAQFLTPLPSVVNIPHAIFLVAQMIKHLPTMQETWVQSLCQEDLLEKEMAPRSSTLAWRIPWTEEPGGLQSTGSQRVRHD